MNWNRTLTSGIPSNCYHHSQLDSVNSNIFHQLSTTRHNYEGYLPSAPLQASNDVFDSDMSELCNIILSDSFCNGNSNGNNVSNSSNGEEFQQQRNCLTTTDVSTTSTCTQYSQENFMALNSFVSASADSLPDTGAGFNSNYRHDCYDDYYRPDCYAEASCHSTLATATEQHSPPSSSSSPQCSAAGADPTTSAFVSPRELQEVFDDLTRRPTDPIGKVRRGMPLSLLLPHTLQHCLILFLYRNVPTMFRFPFLSFPYCYCSFLRYFPLPF